MKTIGDAWDLLFWLFFLLPTFVLTIGNASESWVGFVVALAFLVVTSSYFLYRKFSHRRVVAYGACGILFFQCFFIHLKTF